MPMQTNKIQWDLVVDEELLIMASKKLLRHYINETFMFQLLR